MGLEIAPQWAGKKPSPFRLQIAPPFRYVFGVHSYIQTQGVFLSPGNMIIHSTAKMEDFWQSFLRWSLDINYQQYSHSIFQVVVEPLIWNIAVRLDHFLNFCGENNIYLNKTTTYSLFKHHLDTYCTSCAFSEVKQTALATRLDFSLKWVGLGWGST